MPYGRKYYGKKRSYKRKYWTGKKYFNKRKYTKAGPSRRLSDGTTYTFKRYLQFTTINGPTNPATSLEGGFQFSINDLPNNTEFLNLFDCYKITGVALKFIPRATENATTAGTLSLGDFVFCSDFDDANAPASQAELYQRQSTRIVQPLRPWKHFLRPKAAMAVYSGSAFNAYAQTTNATWIDCNSPTVPYYGFKYAWCNVNSSTAYSIDVFATYYLKFRNTR